MGKYNFNYEKVQNLEKENAELKKRLEHLESLVNRTYTKRDFITKMDNNKIVSIFGLEVKENGIKQTTDRKIINSQFCTFYMNILRLVFPRASRENRLVYKKIEDMSEEEYQIAVETLQSIVDILDYAKNKLIKMS